MPDVCLPTRQRYRFRAIFAAKRIASALSRTPTRSHHQMRASTCPWFKSSVRQIDAASCSRPLIASHSPQSCLDARFV
jgi:hypothetical protein